MNIRLVSALLLLLVVMCIAIPTSAMALTGQERRAVWNKYSYRYGDGNPMGWLQTPDFKNGGFEEGNLSHWRPYANYGNINGEVYVGRIGNASPHTGSYMCYLLNVGPIGPEGYMGVEQTVTLTHATGISIWSSFECTGDDYNPEGSVATLQVLVDDVVLYERTVTDMGASSDWVEGVVEFTDTYRGSHTVSINMIGYACQDVAFRIDDVKLLGPGF